MKLERKYAIQGRGDSEAARVAFMVEHMSRNRAYVHHIAKHAIGDANGEVIEAFRKRYLDYRTNWRAQPRAAIEKMLSGSAFAESGMIPLCVDIEVAAVCDLACPFCFRQHIVTPDKIIREDLYRRIIDQCAEMGVPSVKMNWRGEPLLHPKFPEFVDYAKRAGILEVIVNTNATTLDDKKAREIIEAGLDLMIYSFDGGSKDTYDRMRPGRFEVNTFEAVYGNIRRFAEVRREMKAVFPRTKIQMILTGDTFGERDEFFALFEDCVDDVSVKAYTERGGKLPDLDPATRAGIAPLLDAHNVDHAAAYWRDMAGNIFVSKGRLPCEQPYQRLMVTYDGRVSMCCYDWGLEYPIGYVDEDAFTRGDQDYDKVSQAIRSGKAGFAEFMADARMPRRFVRPAKRVETLQQIWTGPIVDEVRAKHNQGRLEDVPVCTRCPFKETYDWLKIEFATTR